MMESETSLSWTADSLKKAVQQGHVSLPNNKEGKSEC